MTTLIIITAIIQFIAVAMGVGSSTIAVSNFFYAISDGKIDECERKMMQVTYNVLRTAMMLILITTAILTYVQYQMYGVSYFTPFVFGFWLLIFVLFTNAVLMTKHLVPGLYGPALQASTWYTMAVLMALFSLGLYAFSYTQFIIGYATMIIFWLILLHTLRARQTAQKQ